MYSACSLQNESCWYCEGKCRFRSRCVKRPAVHTVTYSHCEPWSGHVHIITKPQGGWGWKGPLEIISSNHLLQASTAGCSEPCLGGLWNLQRWISTSSMGSPWQCSIITVVKRAPPSLLPSTSPKGHIAHISLEVFKRRADVALSNMV